MNNHETIVTTPPAKQAASEADPPQQRLLRLRVSYCSTLAPEGSIRAYWVAALARFKFYVRASPAQPAT